MGDASKQPEAEALGPDPHARSLFNLAKAYATGAFSVGPQILGNPWLPSSAIRSLAFRRLRAVVADAKTNVSFYREAFRAVRPESLVDEEALTRLPLLTKELVRAEGERLVSANAPPTTHLLDRASSGSSGIPVKLFFDPLRDLPRRVQELRLLTANGFRPWHSQMIFDQPASLPGKKFFVQRLGIWDREVFPQGTNWSAEQVVRFLDEKRPDILHGVLSGLRMLALTVQRVGEMPYEPRLIVSKGELLDPGTRRLIERVLRARLVDYYATEEVGIVAWQCPSGRGYHVDQDLVFVEVVDDRGRPCRPGEVGEVIVTNLYNRTMPIIRYQTGDLASLASEPCTCGRGLPLLRNLHGRTMDLIVTPDRWLHHPFRLMGVFEEVPGVRQFRIVQTALERLVVQIAWEDGVTDAEARNARVVRGLSELLGPSISIVVEPIERGHVAFDRKFALVRGLGQAPDALMREGYQIRF